MSALEVPTAATQVVRLVRCVRSWLGSPARLLSDHILALADQGVVSAASFITTVLISRYSDAAQLGAYAIGFSVLASMYTFQGQLISLPYSIQQRRAIGTAAEHAGGALALMGLLASFATLLLALVALSLFASGAQDELTAVTWAVAGVMPFALSRDFFRRFAFSHLQMARALMLDGTVAALQLLSLGWLAWTGRMSAVTATVALGASCGVAAIGCLVLARARFSIRANQVCATMKQSWKLGKWLVANQIMVQIQRYSASWLLIVMAGATATGIYAACMSIVAFSNPLFYGLNNLFTQKSVLAWQQGGGASLRRRAFKDLALLGAIMGLFCFLALWLGEDVMQLFYRGPQYMGYGHLVAVLAFAILAFVLGTPAGNALASMERPRVVLFINSIGTVLTAAVVWRSLALWGLSGAAFGLLLSNAIVAAGLWLGFLWAVRRVPDDRQARKALGQLVGASNSAGWTITYLGEGDHSVVYSAKSSNGAPSWQRHRTLILKVYKPKARLVADMVQAQSNSLLGLYRSLSGHKINEWTITIPMPLYVCKTPLALVMTAVPGKDLKSNTATDNDLTPEILQSLGRTVVAALRQGWPQQRMHGDLGLQNILYDLKTRQLAFIDPGTPECCFVCMQASNRWKPGILELGHILRDLGTDIRDLTGHRTARLRREAFVTSALRTFAETIGTAEERQQVLDEIFDCAQEHLSQVIKASWLLTIFSRPLRIFVARRMDAVLATVREQLAAPTQTTDDVKVISLQPTLMALTPERNDTFT